MVDILKGMRVIEGSAFVAVPLAGLTLAQMGAEVIRFDRLEGGLDSNRWPVNNTGQSFFWAGLNKGKKSIAIDMRSSRGRELITQLIAAEGQDSGIFITNLRVKGWLDYKTLSQVRKDLIMVTLKGDRKGRPQVDYTVNPALGIPSITGPEGAEDPVAHALPAWDCIAGNLMVSSLLAAERQRFRDGIGQDVELSLKDVAAAITGHLGMIGEATINTSERGKSGNALYGAFGNDFRCADGRRVMVIGLTARQWSGLVKATNTQDKMAEIEKSKGMSLQEEGNRWKLRHEITKVLEPWFSSRKIEDFASMFDELGLTWSQFRTLRQALKEDADLSVDNPIFTMNSQPELGTFLSPSLPANFSNYSRKAAVKAPALGEDTEEILGDVIRLDDTEISSLFDSGIVAGCRKKC